MKFNTSFLKSDLLSGAVVFLVALPLCLGIALASGAPLFSGIIAGIIGGIVIGILSGSELSVSGPAAGLTAIVLAAVTTLGNFETFLVAVMIAGAIQIVLGLLKAGTISNYFPSNVIEGMLTGIGIIIILKQIPHAVGYDKDVEGDVAFQESATGHNTITSLLDAFNHIQPGAVLITLISLAILIAFNQIPFLKKLKAVPGALVAVVCGVIVNEIFKTTGSSLTIEQEHLVNLPVTDSIGALWAQLPRPDFSAVMRGDVWLMAATVAAVGSIETLLCIEASDKIDPLKRYSNTNQELLAQGTGNIISGLLGGLPMTSVIVRTSANVNSGARTRIAAISHGVFLLVAVLAIPSLLNKIPLATLAGILLMIGWKLANPSVFKHMWHTGYYQFIPFIVTVMAVVGIDLLKGVGIGLLVSIFFILRANLKLAYFFDRKSYQDGETVTIKLAQEVSF